MFGVVLIDSPQKNRIETVQDADALNNITLLGAVLVVELS